jgi:PemK-like, MazF-like toxin of type II toxin-antitoxin system
VELPEPEQGLVFCYSYLWRSEAERGRAEGRKDRPCAVVLAVKREGVNARVYVAPITHSPPEDKDHAVEIPAQTKQRLKLDNAQSWIVTTEVNVFTWPGPDVRAAYPTNPHDGIVFGYLPYKTARKVADAVREHARAGRGKIIERDEIGYPKRT